MIVAGLILAILPGCLGGNKEESKGIKAISDGSPAMFTIDGVTLITEKSFQEYFDNFVANNPNPQLQMMLQVLPNAKEEIFKARANEDLMLYWAEKDGIAQTEEYKAKFEQGIRMVRVGLAAEAFQKTFAESFEPTENDLRAYYEQHKEIELVTERGGIKAIGVECTSKAQAQELYAQAKQNPKQFKTIAGARAKALDITPQAPIDPAIKEAASAVSTFPTAITVEATDGKTWVIVVNSKQAAKYIAYDDVKQGIYQAVKQERMAQAYLQGLNELKSKYNTVENFSSLTAAANAQATELPDAQALQELEEQVANMSDEELQATINAVEAQAQAEGNGQAA